MASDEVASPAFDAVLAAQHPSPEQGGPCATCAFRPGTEASRSEHTVVLARLCVEGGREFHCHEKAQLCRGWIAAVNLRGVPFDDLAGACADWLGDAIEEAAALEPAP
jgi:hypothetical protein